MRGWNILIVTGLVVMGAVTQSVYAEQNVGEKATRVGKGGKLTEQQRIEHRLSSMTKKLGLSTEQQTAIKPILEEERMKLNEMANDTGLTNELKRAKLQELRSATFDKIHAILTPEQQQTFDDMRKKALARPKIKRGN